MNAEELLKAKIEKVKTDDAPLVETPKQNEDLVHQKGYVTGTFARSQTTTLGEAKRSSIDLLRDKISKVENGTTRTRPLPLNDSTEVVVDSTRKKTVAQLFEEKRDIYLNSFDFEKIGAGIGAMLPKEVVKALSVDENAIVKYIWSPLLGAKSERADFSEYTYTNLLKETMASDDPMYDKIGLALAIVGSPSTYLTGGLGKVPKAIKATEGVALTNKGLDLANKIALERVQAKTAGKKVALDVQNQMLQAEQKNVIKELGTHLGEIKSATDEVIKVNKDVAKVNPKGLIDPGGLKLAGVPIIGEKGKLLGFKAGDISVAGVPVLKGEQVVKALDNVGVTSAVQKLSQLDVVKDFGNDIGKIKSLFGKAFIPNYKADVDMLNAFKLTEVRAKQVAFDIAEEEAKFFSGLSQKEINEFGKIAIDASVASKATGQKIPLTSKNPKIQEKLNEFYGQKINKDGVIEFTGRGKADFIAKELQEKGYYKLTEEAKIPTWFPGISSKINDVKFQWPKTLGPAQREFLQGRVGDHRNYNKNALQAMVIRRTQIAYANIQDEMFKKLVENKVGGTVVVKSGPVAAGEIKALQAQGYVPIAPPMSSVLSESADITKRMEGDLVMAPKEFAEQYNKAIYDQSLRVPGLSWAVDHFKTAVTVGFPAFSALNAASNTVLNAYSIGIHAVNPKRVRESLIAAMNNKAPTTTLGKVSRSFVNMATRANPKELVVTNLGEKIAMEDLIKEMNVRDITPGGFQDISGIGLSKQGQKLWQFTLNRLNPMSKEFFWFANMGEIARAVENQARALNYIHHRVKGLSPDLSAQLAKDALFDYGNITKFEQGMKLVMPFYTFRSKNLKLHMQLLASKPGVIRNQLRVIDSIGPTEDELEDMPEWARNRFSASIKGHLVAGQLLPLEDVFHLAEEGQGLLTAENLKIMSQINPYLKYPAERSLGLDFYSDRPIRDIDYADDLKWTLDMANDPDVPDFIKVPLQKFARWAELKEKKRMKDGRMITSVQGNPDKLHILRNTFTSRFQSVIGFVQKEDKEPWEIGLRLLTGVIRIEPNRDQVLSEEKRKAYKRAMDKIAKSNEANILLLPVAVSPDPRDQPFVEFANETLGEYREANKRQLQRAEKQLFKRLERIHERHLQEVTSEENE